MPKGLVVGFMGEEPAFGRGFEWALDIVEEEPGEEAEEGGGIVPKR